jgi:hypothetical protein
LYIRFIAIGRISPIIVITSTKRGAAVFFERVNPLASTDFFGRYKYGGGTVVFRGVFSAIQP